MKLRALIISLFISVGHINAEVDFNDNCKLTYEAIINFDFSTAEALLVKESQEHPDNLSTPYLECLRDVLFIYIEEGEEGYQQFLLKSEKTIKQLQDSPRSSYQLLMLGELNLFRAILKFKFRDVLSGAMNLLKSKKHLEECKERYPNFLPVNLFLGMLHASMGSVPDQYKPYLKYFLGFEGTVWQGLNEFDQVLNSKETYLHPLASFLKAYVTHELTVNGTGNLEDSGVSLEGSMTQCYQASLWMKYGKTDEAIDLLEEHLDDYKELEMYFPYYLLGRAKLNKLDKEAVDHLRYFTEYYRGKNFLKSAYGYLASYYFVSHDLGKFYNSKNFIYKVGDDYVGADQQALKMADNWPNEFLLKAQLLFDGGDYQSSLRVIDEFKRTPEFQEHRIECLYREASNFLMMGKVSQAKDQIDQILRLPPSGDYFQPNAAMKLGREYEKLGNKALALDYFNKALEYENYPYEAGVSQKAKAGIRRLE